MAKRIDIGSETFLTKAAVWDRVRGIIANTEDEVPVEGDDALFVAALYLRHKEYALRTAGRLISHFTVSHAKGGSRCFYVVFEGGKMENFSVKNCLA